jgi:SNF2 family DNA or RNA helicase
MKANQVIALEKSKSGITTSFLTDTSAASSASLESDVSESKKTTRDGSLLRQILREALDMESSSKMNAIFQELDIVWNMDPGSKVLIFSHYLGFLDLLEARLRREGVEFFRLDGSLNLKQRSKVLDAFRICTTSGLKKTRGSVLLMSMAAGGEGLNLTAASTCFLCEPWWNSAKEDQCVSRISRIGQQAQHVKVRKFIVVNSVEERIVELQQRKAYMADEIYSEESLRESSAAKAARLTLEEFRHLFRK